MIIKLWLHKEKICADKEFRLKQMKRLSQVQVEILNRHKRVEKLDS